MTGLPKKQRPTYTGQKRLTIGEEIERISKSKEETLKFFKEIDEIIEESEKFAAAAKEKNEAAGAGSSSGFNPNKVTKPWAKKPRRMPPDEFLARLSQVAQYDPEARRIWQDWCSGKWTG